MSVYLDHNATAPLDERVLAVMLPWLSGIRGNPASVHRYGREALDALETARSQVAELVNARPPQVIFTGGGTEADNLALKGVCRGEPQALVVGRIEHAAVLGPADALSKQGWRVDYLPVDDEGRYDLDALDRLLEKGGVRIVSAMLANNETGVVEDVATASERAHAQGALLHTDAVQAAGKQAVDFRALGADLMTLSAHKLNGPRGVGALIRERHVDLAPLVDGGGQEQGLRAGTENLAGIVGFGKAAELAKSGLAKRMRHDRALRERLEAGVRRLPGARIFSAGVERLCNTSQFGFTDLAGEWMVMELDKRGFAVSSGSACHSKSGEPSHVLLALGFEPAVARSAVRVSFGAGNTEADVDTLLAALAEILSKSRGKAAAVGW